MHDDKTTMRRLGIAAALVAALGVAGPAAAQKPWSLGTSSTGSGPYVNGVIIANQVNKGQSALSVSAQTSGGYNENVTLVATKRMDMGMTSSLDLDDAHAGTGKFAKLPNKEVFNDLRAAFVFAGSACHFATRADSGIKTFADIKGKKVNLNAPSTFTRGFNEKILKALNIGLDEIQVFSISTGKHFDALQDRVIDVGMHCYSIGYSGLLKLTATTPVHLLSLPDDAFDRLNDMYGGVLNKVTIEAGTYPGQAESAQTVFNTSVLFVHKDADADDVYAFTKAFWDKIGEMGKEDAAFRGITVEVGNYKGKTPMHPGAERFFKEKGLR